MDAFFASVELLRYPQLRGHAVVVGGRRALAPRPRPDGSLDFARLREYAGRGVVTTSTYEARALGVFSGMGLMHAARLAPDAVLLPADFDAYRRLSAAFKAAVAGIAPEIEDRGIDEIYIDLSALPDDTPTLARRIKQAVHDATGLSCSIGIAPNKLLAKLASDLDKPDGITLLDTADLHARVWPLPARRLGGIGPKTDARLAELGLSTLGDIARADPALLQQHFGRTYATWLMRAVQGIDARPVQTRSEPKSVSRETTFDRDLHPRADRDELSGLFTHLCERVAADLRARGYVGRTIGIKLRFDDFRTVTRDVTLEQPTADAAQIRRAAGACLRRIELNHRLRLLGVRVGALSPDTAAATTPAPTQLDLGLGAGC